jgi:hypothetical protein
MCVSVFVCLCMCLCMCIRSPGQRTLFAFVVVVIFHFHFQMVNFISGFYQRILQIAQVLSYYRNEHYCSSCAWSYLLFFIMESKPTNQTKETSFHSLEKVDIRVEVDALK